MSEIYQLRRSAGHTPRDGTPGNGRLARLRSAWPLARRQLLIELIAVTPR